MYTNDDLLLRQACADLVARYAWLNDERRFEELARLFTDDAVLYRPSAPDQAITGRAAILEAMRKRPETTVTLHVTSDLLVERKDANTVHLRSKMLMFSGARSEPGSARPPAVGTFDDVLALTPDGWKFAQRRGALAF